MRFSIESLIVIVIAVMILSISVLEISGVFNIFPSSGVLDTLNIPSFGVILGGLLLSLSLSQTNKNIRDTTVFATNLLFHPDFSKETEKRDISELFNWQKELKTNYNLARVELSKKLSNTFEGYLFTLVNTNYEPDKIRELGLIKAKEKYANLRQISSIFEQLSDTAPAYGMLGTLIGLIFMLQRFENVQDLGEGLAFALMTTFYGLIFAYTLFTPLAKKAALYADKSLKRDLFILNGFIMILNGDEPLAVFDHLCADREGYLFDDELTQMDVT